MQCLIFICRENGQIRVRENDVLHEERKRRTKRLIEMGAIVESILGRPTTDDDKERLQAFLRKQEANGKFFTKAMNVQP